MLAPIYNGTLVLLCNPLAPPGLIPPHLSNKDDVNLDYIIMYPYLLFKLLTMSQTLIDTALLLYQFFLQVAGTFTLRYTSLDDLDYSLYYP